jgi:predicted transcriptional regulator
MMWTYPDTRYYYDWYEGMPPASAHPGDGTIKAAVVDRLRVNPLTKDDDLRVDVKRGVVILQGVVGSRLAKRSAGDDCWDTVGVTDVSNQLEVADAVEQGAGAEPVSAIMSSDVVALEAASPLRSAAEAMRDQDVGSVVVTDGGHVTGLVTDRDMVIRAAAEGRDMTATTVGSICSDVVLSVDREASIDDVVRLMRNRAVRRVVVTEAGDRPVGVVSLGDLARRRDPGSVLADVTAAPADEA